MSKPRSYLIHDNGGRPFRVEVHAEWFRVYGGFVTNNDRTPDLKDPKEWPRIVVRKTRFIRAFVGRSVPTRPVASATFKEWYETGPRTEGNSMLFHLGSHKKHSYMIITSSIVKFQTDHEIKAFHSPIGNNDVPYPFAIDAKRNYIVFIHPDTFPGILCLPTSKVIVSDEAKLMRDPYVDYTWSRLTKKELLPYKIHQKIVRSRE